LENIQIFYVRAGLAWLRIPALSGSRYSGNDGGDGGARGVRVRSEGDGIAKGIAGGGEREKAREKTDWRVDPRVVAVAMLIVTVGSDGVGGARC